MQPFEAEAGREYGITVEWNFSNPNIPNDWSVVAWAPAGSLTIEHEEGLITDVMPVIDKLQ